MAATNGRWGSAGWYGAKTSESLMLKKGESDCSVCLTSKVEVRLNPCGHELCLDCCNRLRATNIFKVRRGRSARSRRSPRPTNSPLRGRLSAHRPPPPPQVDSGIRCPECRGYAEGFADLLAHSLKRSGPFLIELLI